MNRMDLDSTLLQKIAKESGTSPRQVAATLDLLEKPAAIPFIARYRKEATGNLDEPRIRRIAESLRRYRALLKRRQVILARIEDRGKLTDELRDRILACYDRSRLEDLYSPFKPRQSREASAAGEKGLEPLAKKLWEQDTGEFSVDAMAEEYLSEEKGVATREEAIEGALAIAAGWVAQDSATRGALRQLMSSEGMLVSKVVEGKAGEKTRYDSFYDFRKEISRIPFHRLTLLRRGVKDGILTLEIELDDQKALGLVRDKVIRQSESPCAPYLEKAVRHAWFKALKPLLQAEVRSNWKEKSDNEALKLFQANLANLLLAPPLGSVPVMGIDPGARSACRIAVVDATGTYREHATFGPGLPRKNSARAEAILYRLIRRHGTHAIGIGNGVGSRETERFVKSFLAKYHAGHPFDLSLVRGKAARSESPAGKEEKVEGQAASESSGPGEDSPAGATQAVGEPNPPREDPIPAAEREDAGSASDPARPKAQADTPPESAPADSSSEGNPAPAVSAAAGGVESPAGENTRRNGEPESTSPVDRGTPEPDATSPVDRGTPEPAEAAPPATTTPQAAPDAGQSRRPQIFSAIVHKGGTAAYANSEGARKEFPKLDLGVRGAISIARRMQDPLAELAKIQPKAIVAGPAPREVDPKRLKRELRGTVESCINQVGVDVNKAPAELLAHVAGLNATLARNIVEYRRQHGPFPSRVQLKEVPELTDSSFEQAAGFLRVPDSEQPLDGTAIHPECYGLVEELAASVQATVAELMENPEKLKALDLEKLSKDRFGLATLRDIRRELSRRGQDLRRAFVPPSFRTDVKELSDLQKGMLVEGTVSNVTSFGAFVDIGVQQEGLVHVSELSSRFVQDANQAVHVGQVVQVKVIGVDTDTNRISLSIKALQARENSGKRERKKPLKTRAGSSSPTPKPAHASAGERRDPREKRRPGKPKRKPPDNKGRQRKKRRADGAKTAAIPPKRTTKPEAPVLPDTSNLSLPEKIRLLQEKFSGIR